MLHFEYLVKNFKTETKFVSMQNNFKSIFLLAHNPVEGSDTDVDVDEMGWTDEILERVK